MAVDDPKIEDPKPCEVDMAEASVTNWTHDVVDVLRTIGLEVGDEFNLQDVYRSIPLLKKLHPQNNHIEAKLRQQLQVLKDLGVVEFINHNGEYRLLRWPDFGSF